MNNSLIATLNSMTDDELIKEIAAAYQSLSRIKHLVDTDDEVTSLKEQLKEAMLPYKEREAHFKKYVKTLAELATVRGINLKTKEITE